MNNNIKGVTLVMYWSQLIQVRKIGRLHVTCEMLQGLRSSVSQLPWRPVSAAVRTPISAHIATDTCRHDNMPWSVQIADLNVSVFANFFRSPIWRYHFLVQYSQIGNL